MIFELLFMYVHAAPERGKSRVSVQKGGRKT